MSQREQESASEYTDAIDKRYNELITKRSSIKGQITKFKKYLTSTSKIEALSNIQLTELSLKLAKFEALSVRFDDLQDEIEVLYPDNIKLEIEERESIECDFVINIATAKNLIESFNKNQECEKRRNSVHDTSCCLEQRHHHNYGVEVPRIQIAKFDGSHFHWLRFRDTFTSLIHNNERIPSISKFHYLLSYLEGAAASVLDNLEVSEANYIEAWNLLCNRFNNKRVLIKNHFKSLLSFKPMTHESESSLRNLIDHVTKNLRALASLGQPTDMWDGLIIYIFSTKLDQNTLSKWEEHRKTLKDDVPTLKQFFTFLNDRADVLENTDTLPSTSQGRPAPQFNQKLVQNSNTKSLTGSNYYKLNNTMRMSCVICNGSHRIYDCHTFKGKGIDDRYKDVIKHKLCGNCLRSGHSTNECRLGPCRICKGRHNSLLHRQSVDSNLITTDEQQRDCEVIANFSSEQSNQVLLSTAIIQVSNPITHQKAKVRALLDCGSQSTFITESLKSRLSLKSNPIGSMQITGIGNISSKQSIESVNIQIKSINKNYNVSLSCLVLKKLTGYLPKSFIDIQSINIPKDIQLADPTFYQPAPIDILIGADLFWDLLGNEQRSLDDNNTSTKLRNSQLGWIISGPISAMTAPKVTSCNHATISDTQNEDIQNMLTKFWDLEEVSKTPILSQSAQYCENHFTTHTTRDSSGRFCVKLPLKNSADCLGDTYHLAKKRLMYLEKRFRKSPALKLEYSDFINEYAELGHLSYTDNNNINIPTEPHYYLCHHAVFKQDSESTKTRVVFDGSAPSTSGYSLNDILQVGPNIQDTLFAILLRARQYKYLLTGDISKFYRQILVHDSDRNLQLILWRENESQPIQTLKLNTVTYGTSSASYLSTRCLFQLGEEQHDQLIKTIIQRDFLVDDLITGHDDLNQLKYIQQSVTNALKSGCFNLIKFKSNCSEILDNISVNNEDKLIISESSSTLGLGWTPSSDTFNVPLKNINSNNEIISKRYIMSNTLKIFDPLGLLSPVIIQPKMLLQKLWKLKIDWDQPVPQSIKDDWIKFIDNIKYLINLQIPRLVLCDLPRTIEIHTFSDASLSAMGACIYIKSIHNNKVTICLLCAKSKVCPVKPTTIPRLELCAALLAARLSKSVLDSIRYKPDKIYHWCDSSVVLSWINSDPSKLKTFVGNRIHEISQLTNSSAWRYVPSECNPADLISRGVTAKQLIKSNVWWSGPDFLYKNESEWPILNVNQSNTILELKSHTITISQFIDFNNYSSFNKILRTFAYVLRCIHNLRNSNKRVGILTISELRDSFHSLCIISQRESFSKEYELLLKGKQLNSNSKILSLSPFLDTNKVIRVGGRIDASIYSYDKKHPILLHASHKLTKLYFIKQHVDSMHAGPLLLLSTIRETVWPVDGRRLARRTVNNCVRCRRLRGKTLQPKMGDLPPQRINVDFPFLSVGLDFAGPFFILNSKGRGSRLIKCYLCLFVCLRFKCIHLEAVSDLSKDAFVMTLKRFVSRRGKPAEIFCDNGRNFVAASKEIGAFLNQNQEPLLDFASQLNIKFTFIPAYAPHFGGIWEAGVKSAKFHLKRVMGNSHLTYEEISTLFAQVEAILNSRPLCPLSSSPNDFLALSPGHFIIGRPLTALPASDLAKLKESQLKRYERLEKIRQHYWQRWQREYISELQQRTKWRTSSSKINVGDMVLLAEDNTPPLQWRLGRIQRLFPGPDGVTRVADVNTTKGCVRRALVRLCPLPTAEELQE